MKKLISFAITLALCLTFFGCNEGEEYSQSSLNDQSQSSLNDQSQSSLNDQSQSSLNDQSQSSLNDQSELNVQEDWITVEHEQEYIYGKIVEKIEPNILCLESGNLRLQNEYGERVDIITDQFDKWEIDAEIEVLFTKYKPSEGDNPTRICADNIIPYMPCAKPIIYFYPEEETTCSVELVLNGKLTCTYPEYEQNCWSDFIAQPDGTLVFPDGKSYYALYWEGISYTEWDFSKGFCVKGEETAPFLEWALSSLGLTSREANEFIIYWLPLMQNNAYNVIAFQTDAYEESAVLNVTPTPDTMIRVFMAWHPQETEIDIEPQMLEAPERNGFTVVEWGGSMVKGK